jgi:Tol biopolymer transport system component
MPLSVAARLGPYEVLGPLGAGGMGEVYRARDTRLERIVALKVLPAELATSPERRARFEREAKAVSALNHPHICTLHDVGRHDGIDYLVLEYIEGETLAERLKRGPLPLEQVLRYGVEIADALDKAHRHGIVHRDLKPGNVMLTRSGTKLLDFGLAKLKPAEARAAESPLSEMETMVKPGTGPLTGEGRMLGTFQYMAPEQLEGKDADARTDIFALGSLLYEMTTGKRAFTGGSAASVVAAILEREPPPMAAVQPMTPPALDRLVRTCLAKDRDERWQDAHDLVSELKWLQEAAPAATQSRRRERLAWSVAAAISLAALLAAVALAARLRQQTPAVSRAVWTILPPEGVVSAFESGIALSPDHTRLAFTAITADGQQLLWVRSMETGQAIPIADTDDVRSPFWSPDGRFIAFFARGKLKKVSASGGAPQTLCAVGLTGPYVGTWGANDSILFHGQQALSILQVSARGGTPREVTRLDASRGEVRHWIPEYLPDGRHFLYQVRGREAGIYIGDTHGGPGQLLVPDDSGRRYGRTRRHYVSPDYVLLHRDEGLFAQGLDRDGSHLGTEALTVAKDVSGFVSASGSDLVYRCRRGPRRPIHIEWKDRAGNTVGRFTDLFEYAGLRLSPDGSRLALDGQPTPDSDWGLWLYETTGAPPRRLGPSGDGQMAWSPDGQRLAHRLEVEGKLRTVIKSIAGPGLDTTLLDSAESISDFATDWSADGKWIALLRVMTRSTRGTDIWLASPELQETKALLEGDTDEGLAVFSPDGRWLAYTSMEAGPPNVYVLRLEGEPSPRRVSTDGGLVPRWRRDGRELFYLAPSGRLMAVPILSSATMAMGAARSLCDLEVPPIVPYDVSSDGQRFLVPVLERATPMLTYIQNWAAGLPSGN